MYASSSVWNQTFRDYLEDEGFGDERYGYEILARDQVRELPWDNLDTISVRFSEDVLVDFNDLQIRGINVPNYTLDPASFRYDADTRTATWRMAANNLRFRADRIILDLDGDSPNGVRDAEGTCSTANGRTRRRRSRPAPTATRAATARPAVTSASASTSCPATPTAASSASTPPTSPSCGRA